MKLARARSTGSDGLPVIALDSGYIREAAKRLTLWEKGLLYTVLLQARFAKRPSKAQRALLALFASTADAPPTAGGDHV